MTQNPVRFPVFFSTAGRISAEKSNPVTMRQRLALTSLVTAALVAPSGTVLHARETGGYNSFGVPGMIDMPVAYGRDDGELAFSVSHFSNQTRTSLAFQVSDRLSAAFRYSFLYDIRSTPGGETYPYIFDRSFSLHYRIMDEGRYMPAFAIGINDLVGTGIYGGEYLVATKTFSPQLRASLGIGWGRLGSYGGFSNPLGAFSDRFRHRPTDRGAQGGTFEPGAWFRGDAALFGGIEWQVNDRLRLIAEYSSDDYAREDGAAFEHKSPLNFGLTWQLNDRTMVAANYLYGSELGLRFTYALNPKQARSGSGLDAAPPPILPRGNGGGAASAGLTIGGDRFASLLGQGLGAEGLVLEGVEQAGKTLRIQIRNDRYAIASQATGRAARVLTRLAPPETERFEIILATNGMPVTRVTLRRQDLEELEFHPVAPDLLRVNTMILDDPAGIATLETLYPRLSYGLDPYLIPSLFDPDEPLRLDIGLALSARYEPLPGLVFSGRINQKLAGNLDEGNRPSTSVLPRVRSEAYLYYKGGDTTIPELTGAWYFRPGEDLFGRVTAGLLETMFAGVSAELLWKPQNSRLALGIEVNHTRQRDYDQLFTFLDYTVTTGHISAYYDLGRGYEAQLDIGRYLAGDHGATLTLAREFENGWRIGVFATQTNVSATEFGEGSFDKGITITIPLDWVTGKPDKTRYSTVIRPVQRDGGARLNVSGRLHETVRGLQATELDGTWGRFWR